MPWTADQILTLAPDAASAKAGRDLASPRKWHGTGTDGTLAWGLCQGSGKLPYQTCIDLAGPAFKCTCPSRKFPCKHGLGLFLTLAQNAGVFTETTPPDWASEWLAKRGAAAEKKAEKKAEAAAGKTPEELAKAAAAAEKRAAKRAGNVSAGLAEFHLWLRDAVRSGLAAMSAKDWTYFTSAAARLEDSQAPGLARRVRSLSGIPSTGAEWPGRFLAQAALLHLVCEGWSRVDSLPPGTAADLRSVIGFTENKEALLASAPPVTDRWAVMGSIIDEDVDQVVQVQRTWLRGVESGRWALSLSFSAGGQPLDVSMLPGTVFSGELVYYPGAWPLRAVVKSRLQDAAAVDSFPGAEGIAAAGAGIAEALIACPWLEQVPVCISPAVPVWREEQLCLRDSAGDMLPLRLKTDDAWRLYAISGGHPLAVFGEWTGEFLRPLSCFSDGRFLRT